MSRRRSLGLAGVVALTAFISQPLGAQSAVPADARTTALALGDLPARPRPVALKQAYRIHLQSMWPQLAGGAEGCFNGGEETLDGTLAANADGTYRGTFTRWTRLLFCGVHGAGAGEGCELTLKGEGEVSVSAVVIADESSPSGRVARLLWVPSPGHRADVSGACPDAFKEAVESMYLNVHHGVELPLTEAGSAPLTEQLQGYPWRVEVE